MSLKDGDYLKVIEKVIETLKADVSAGGLREPPEPPVKTIEAKIRREAKLYSKYQLPLLSVALLRKREEPAPSSQMLDKIFELEFLILARGGDREREIDRVKKIAARLEKIIKEQNQPDQQFQGLPRLIEGSQGLLLARVKETSFENRFLEEASGKNPEVVAIISAELVIPARCFL